MNPTQLKKYRGVIENSQAKKIEYTISDKYVKDLTPRFGIKEILANFYDQNGQDFHMNYEKGTLLLQDEGTGIDIQYMIIGNSGSREDEQKIGEHGEGLKIGALTLVREGNQFLLDTVGYTIAFGLEYSDLLKTNVLYAKFVENNRKVGTEIFFECKKTDFEAAKKMFLVFNENQKVTDQIVQSKEKIKRIYLNGLEHTKKTAIFSYNILQKNQISNRDRNYIDQDMLQEEIAEIYNQITDENTIKVLMEKWMEHAETFDKQLEAKLIKNFSLSKEQKRKYCDVLPEDVWYTDNKRSIDEKTHVTKKIREVSREMYHFLSYIGAENIFANKKESLASDFVIRTFELNPSKIHSIEELEIQLGKLALENFRTSFLNEEIFFESAFWSSIDLEKEIKKLNFSYRNPSYLSKMKDVLTVLIQLATQPQFEFTFFQKNRAYQFVTYTKEGKSYVSIRSKKTKEHHLLKLHVENRDAPVDKVEYREQNYIYIANLKATSQLLSLFTYRIKKLKTDPHAYRKDYLGEVKNSLQELIETESENLFKEIIKEMQLNLFEFALLPPLQEREKEVFQEFFQKARPKTCLAAENEEHNMFVQDKYGYEVVPIENEHFLNWLQNNQIPDATKIIHQKQHQDIITVEPSEAIIEGIKIFRRLYDTSVEVKCALSLPDEEESTHQERVIYIGKKASAIPHIIASLIAYEYEQIRHNAASPSQTLQNVLTHNLFI